MSGIDIGADTVFHFYVNYLDNEMEWVLSKFVKNTKLGWVADNWGQNCHSEGAKQTAELDGCKCQERKSWFGVRCPAECSWDPCCPWKHSAEQGHIWPDLLLVVFSYEWMKKWFPVWAVYVLFWGCNYIRETLERCLACNLSANTCTANFRNSARNSSIFNTYKWYQEIHNEKLPACRSQSKAYVKRSKGYFYTDLLWMLNVVLAGPSPAHRGQEHAGTCHFLLFLRAVVKPAAPPVTQKVYWVHLMLVCWPFTRASSGPEVFSHVWATKSEVEGKISPSWATQPIFSWRQWFSELI